MIANTVKDLMAAVHLASDGSQVASGTIYCVVRLESDDGDDGKFWDSNDDTWQASPVAWPTGTHTEAGQWVFALPAAATNGKAGDTIHYTFTDNLTEASATTVCAGGEHLITVEDPLATSDLSTLAVEANVEGHVTTALNTYDPPTRAEATSDKDEIITEVDANETKIDALPTAVQNAAGVWQAAFAGYTTNTQFGYLMNKVLRALAEGDKEQVAGTNRYIVYDPDDPNTPLFTFDTKDRNGVAASLLVFKMEKV